MVLSLVVVLISSSMVVVVHLVTMLILVPFCVLFAMSKVKGYLTMEVLKNVTGIKVEIKPRTKADLLERESPMSFVKAFI